MLLIGLGYGGNKLCTSAKNLIDLVVSLKIQETAKFISLIDVHTGLGPSGVDTLDLRFGSNTDTNTNANTAHDIESIFPTEYRHNKIIGGIKETFESMLLLN